jgi:hypothetical protein
MENANIITCTKCGAEIPLTEAVSHRVRDQLAAEFEIQRRQLNAALAEREEKLAGERRQLEQRQQTLQKEVANRLESERKEILTGATRRSKSGLARNSKIYLHSLRNSARSSSRRRMPSWNFAKSTASWKRPKPAWNWKSRAG